VFATPEWQAREAAFFAFAFGDLEPREVVHLADLLGRWLAAVALPAVDPDASATISIAAAPASAGRPTLERNRP
jgi:hypothetical protein